MPELSDDLAARLSALRSDGPVTLPGPAAARRRGSQRTRRTRGALAGGSAAVLVVAAVLGAGVDHGEDRVSIPATDLAPAPGPAPSGEPPPTGDGVLEAVLTADDAAEVLPGAWTTTTPPDTGTEVPPFPCGASGAPQAPGDGRVSAGVRLVVHPGTGGTVVHQEVVQYTGPTTAAEAYDLVRERVAACPEQSLPDAQGPGTAVTEVVEAGPELDDGVRTLLVQVVSTCRDCRPATQWYAVQHAGDLLSTTGVAEAGDGERGVAVVQSFAELVAGRLRGTS